MNHLSSLVQITPQNIDSEHICCALGNTPDAIQCTRAKKNWMLQSFAAGYHFCKLNERGKVFIEYTPAHSAWAPIIADGWLFIDCLWVSGRFKGQGYGSLLLQQAILHAQQVGYVGLVAITSDKKRPFLSDPLFYQKKHFVPIDFAPPYYQLVALPLKESIPLPKFTSSVIAGPVDKKGLSLYYSDHCPHTSKYAPILADIACKQGTSVSLHKFTSATQAQSSPNPFTSWAMFWNGDFITNEIFSPDKMRHFLEKNQ